MATATTKPSDAIALLKADHRTVAALFARYEKSKNKSVKAKLSQRICMELSVHTTIEEELFYPSVKGTIGADIYDEAYVEHDGAKILIAELLQGKPGDIFYDAKMKVLSEDIKHHVKEEEQPGGMFAQVRSGRSIDLRALGAAMLSLKKKLVNEMKSSGIPTPATRSMEGAPVRRAAPVI